MPGKLSNEVSERPLVTTLVRCHGGTARTWSLGTMVTVEAVKQRRRDALRITELTERATEALAKLGNSRNCNPFRDNVNPH
jgi:hypothetical protein